MLNRIIAFSIKNKLLIGMFVLALVAYGSYQFTQLPIDAVPDITDNQVQVITVAPSFGATDIERLVTFPVEQLITNIPGTKEIRSFSRFGLSLVTIVFDDRTDVYWARQQVAERLQQIQIPVGIGKPELGPVTTGLGEIYQYVVRPKKGFEQRFSATELRTIQDWIIRRQLISVKGVAEVSSFGGKLKEYTIEVSPERLQAYGISINDIFQALENNNQNTGGAYIEKGPVVLYVRSEGLIGSVDDIKNIPLRSTSNLTPLFIRDVADIKIGSAVRYGAMTYNDEGEVAGAVVMMLKGANSNEVIKNVKTRIEQIKKTLPEGIEIEPFLDRTKMVNNAISTVKTNLLEGALIVILVLVLFLGNLRAGLLVASVIPLSMLFAVSMMNAFGVSGNLMSLGALDFGLIVDGAVIIVEAVMHRLSHSNKFNSVVKLQQVQMDEEVKHSAGKMMNSAVFGQIIILVVYLPILTLQGIEGKMFKPMAQTVSFALLGAFLLSLTYIPMMSTLVLSKKIKHKQNFSDRLLSRLERKYQSALEKVLNFPKVVLGTTLILFALAAFTLSTLGGEFIPALEEGDFAVDTRVMTGSNLYTTMEYTTKAARILKNQFPEVDKVVTKIGSGEVPTDPMPMEASDMMVILKEKNKWTSAKTFDELAKKMSSALQAIPGITTGFQFPVQMRFNELMTGARQDVVIKIFGENLDTLAFYANKLEPIINPINGTEDLYIEPVTGLSQIIIQYDRQRIARYNLNIAAINRIVNTALAGQSAGSVYEGEKHFDLVVRLTPEKRDDLRDIKNLLIPGPDHTQIPLSELADVSIEEGPNQIQREDAKRRIIVGFNVRGRDVKSIVNELQVKADSMLNLPHGYFITYGGAFENLNAASKRLMIAVPVSLLLIFILLYFAFHSVKQGLLIYSAIPLSAIGGIFFLALRGMPFSISAGVGFIALFGIAVLNGIVLIAEFNRLKKEGVTDKKRIVLMGTKVRLRPVLMTAFVASLGFLPMALSNGAGAEVQRPLATVVIGGLMIATFLTLFVLPVLYILFESSNPGKKPPKIPAAPLTLIGIALITMIMTSAQAQTPVSLQAAIDTALKNNMTLQSKILEAEYREKMIKAANDIPCTEVFTEVGQINSSYTDTKYGIAQTINFPTVYARNKNLKKAELRSSQIEISQNKAELIKQVSEQFIITSHLNRMELLLEAFDSLYSEFLNKANIRFDQGEINIIEKATAENQKAQIAMQARQVKQQKAASLLRFQTLLNASSQLIPAVEHFDKLIQISPTTELPQNFTMQYLQQEVNIALINTAVNKSMRLPDIILEYNNNSFIGTGADNQYYTSDKRFHSVKLGLGIPLLTRAQKAKIKAAKVGEAIAKSNYVQALKTITNERDALLIEYQSTLETVRWYEQTGLKTAETISSASLNQFENGDINYLDWVMLVNQAITIKSQYLDSVKKLNAVIIEINYINSK